MANIDQLAIQIQSDSQNAEEALNSLVRGLENLNTALGNLDVSKFSAFSRAASKLSSIGSAASDTSKALAHLASDSSRVEGTASAIEKVGNAAKTAAEQVETLNQSVRVIYGNEIKEHGFTMKDVPQIPKIEFPPAVIPNYSTQIEEKLLPAVIETENEFDTLVQKMAGVGSTEAVYDAITQKFVDWKTQAIETAMAMERIGASMDKWTIPEQTGNKYEFFGQQTGFVSDIIPKESLDYAYKLEDTINGTALALVNTNSTALALADQFKEVEQYARQCFETAKQAAQELANADSSSNTAEQADKVKSAIQQAIEAAREYKRVISEMESGKTVFDEDKYKEAIQGYEEATKAIKEYKEALKDDGDDDSTPGKGRNEDVLTNLIELGDALEELGEKFEQVGEKASKLFSMMVTPLRMVVDEYKEKLEHIGKLFGNLASHVKTSLAKIAAFWKRAMRTFTFMLVRKAITAIIKEINNAIQSMAMFSNAMGTEFNNSISTLVADFQYLGRSIVSVFAPLINFIAPIIDAIIDRIALLLSYIGMLFAALTGASSFTKAKKNVTNYAESLDKASKSAKNLTMGIDELNILSESGGGGSSKPYDGWEDAWEEVDIPSWIKDIADWLKDFWERFFAPLLEAWNRAKQYLIDGFKTMLDALKSMFGHIIDDFLTMWNQEKTIRMFEMILRIVGDLMRVVRNLARQFDKAWQKAKVGLKIFENLRDIAAILVDHVRNVSYYMIGWAKEINFSPMLETFEELTRKLKKPAEFIGGVFEDIMKDGVLKYIEFMINDAIPHLNETIAKIIDSFNFESLREKLKPLWGAFEEAFANIHTGVTTAIGNIGQEIARFTSSKEFDDFLQRIVDVTKLITAQRVEKVLTGLGKGIIAIAKAVVKFVNSKPFMAFLEALAKWIDEHSVDEIAGILTAIAKAIVGFKFSAFALNKLSGFFKVFAMLEAMKNLGSIAGALTKTGQGISSVASGAGLLAGVGTGLAVAVGAIATLAAAFMEFNAVKDVVKKTCEGVELLASDIAKLIAPLGALLPFLGLTTTGLIAFAGALTGLNELKLESLTDAILTQGDTTVAMVKEWYSEATATISENAQKWKDIERNITQDKADLEEYSKTLEGLESALNSSVQATSRMADNLASKYSDMSAAIDNYIDQSTNALVEDLLANRDYYEAKGKNVDEMIANLYTKAEEEKSIYNDTQEAVNKAAEAYSKAYDEATKKAEEMYDKTSESYKESVATYVQNSADVQAAYKDYQDAVDKHVKAIDQYRTATEEIDTNEAVEQITNLGKSLDLSQYTSFEDAATDIKGAVDEINAAYSTGLDEVSETLDFKLNFLKQQFDENRIDASTYNIGVEAAKKEYQDDINSLTDTTKEALDFFDSQLAGKLSEVQANAEREWEEANPFQRFFMGSKEGYAQSQMQTYVDEMLGESGLTGALNAAYANLPANVSESQTAALSQIMEDAGAELSTWDKVVNAGSIGESFKTLFSEGGKSITDWATGKKEELGIWADSLGDDVPSRAKGFIEQIPGAFEETWGGVTEWYALKKEETGQKFEEMFQDAPEKIAYALGFVIGKFESWKSDIYAWLETNIPLILDKLKTEFWKINDKIWEVLTETIKKLFDWKIEFDTFTVTEIPKIIANFMTEFSHLPTKIAELGPDIVQGLINGINDAWEKFKGGVTTFCDNFLEGFREGFASHSPSRKAEDIGIDVKDGLFLPFKDGNTSALDPFTNAFIDAIKTGLAPSKFAEIGNQILRGIIEPLESSTGDFATVINQIFESITQAIQTNLDTLGATLFTMLQTFMQTHVLPFFNTEMWQPLFDNLLNIVLIPAFELFTVWFDESMLTWWEEHMLTWFTVEKWDEDIFTPLAENIHEHFATFSSWWDATMQLWWTSQVEPWFEKDLWVEIFNHVLDATKEVFKKINEAMQENILEAKDVVLDACGEMMEAVGEILEAIGEIMTKLGDLGAFKGKMTFEFGANQFASGGFPDYGSLFIAGEAGAELVGNIHGRTGVVSNGEITGIEDAVYATGSAETELLGQLIAISRAMLDKEPVVIGDRDIARMANSGQSKLGMSIIS